MNINHYNNITQIANYWQQAIEIEPIFGFGFSALDNYKEMFPFLPFEKVLKVFYDNNKQIQNTVQKGIEILNPEELRVSKKKIVVLVSHWHQLPVKEQLVSYGLEEYKDFIAWFELIPILHWVLYKKLFINNLDISITTKCSLKCKSCSLFMPLYKNPTHTSIGSLKSDLDLLFSKVDYCAYINIFGGEALLHPNLYDYLAYIQEKYINRISAVRIITNATVLLNSKLRNICKQMNVLFRVSDYSTSNSTIKNQQQKLIAQLIEFGLNFSLSSTTRWQQVYTENGLSNLSESEITKHHTRCGAPFKGFQDGKYYPCYIQWSADLLGIQKTEPSDVVDIIKTDAKEKIFKYQMDIIDKGYLSLCKHCYGNDPLFYHSIPAAEQI